MKNIVVIDNFDSFTFNLVDYFRKLGNNVEIVRNTVCPEKVIEFNPDLIVFSPGPGSPEHAGNMVAIIEKFKCSIPMLGVCLGHQAIVLAFGGSLKKVNPVHGKISKITQSGDTSKLFKEIPNEFEAGRYHSLAADAMPDCLNITAMSDDNVVMALQHKEYPIYGVQFHPESILTYKNNVGIKIIINLLNSL
jgi:anthranilate synthase/aminodeoxychorismate synthase-like glutamine amidotransferase